MMILSKVFVYGTLKVGRPLDRPELAAARTTVDSNVTIQNARIYNLGNYPTIKLLKKGGGDDDGDSEDNNIVQGELHTFTPTDFPRILQILDQIEGYDPTNPTHGLYNRHIVDVFVHTTKNKEDSSESITTTTKDRAWIYEYNGPIDPTTRLVDGLWEPRI